MTHVSQDASDRRFVLAQRGTSARTEVLAGAHAVLKLLRGTATRQDGFLFLLGTLFVARFAWMGRAG